MPDNDEVVLTVVVTMRDKLDNYHEEDIAKTMWPYFTPYLTRRHGINKGKVILEDGAIEIDWKYENNYKEEIFIDDDY